MRNCPICKSRLISLANSNGIYEGAYCERNHYLFDDKGKNGGFYIEVGNKVITDLYSRSIKNNRIQNMYIEKWVKRERNRWKKIKKG